MGIQINGQTDTVTSTTAGGSVTVTPLAASSGLNVGTGASISSPATNVLTLGTNNTEKVRILSSGSVGIGTNESYGDSNASFTSLSLGGNGTRYGLIELNKSDGIAGSWIDCYGTGGNGDLRITTAGTSGAITFWTGGEFTEKVRVGAAGSVGIATTSPQTKLHIHNAGWVDNIVGTGGLLLSSVDTIGPGIAFRQKEGYYWNLYHGSTSAWSAKGNFGFAWSNGINAASGLSAGITTAGYIVGNRNIIQVVDATTATRVNGAGPFTAITSSSIKCTTNKTRFMISVTCPVNISDDSDAANANSNPYFYGVVERNLNGAGWVTCGGQGSSSQGGVNAHIELSPNRTGNDATDYWSGNRYRMEHKYAHFFDDEISPGSNQTIQFRLRVLFHGGNNWIQIGEPHGLGADDNYPCQRWGMMIYELGPDAPFTMVNTAP